MALNDRKFSSLVEDNKTAAENLINTAYGGVIAGYYSSSAPTLSNGDFAFVRLDAHGRMVTVVDGSSSTDVVVQTATGHDYYVTTTNLGTGVLTVGFDSVAGLALADIIKFENKTQGWIYNTKGATVGNTSILLVAANQTTGYPVPAALDEFEIVYRSTSRFDAIETAMKVQDGDFTTLLDEDADETAQVLTASPGTLVRLSVDNADVAKIYVQLFDVAAGSVTVGTTKPKYVIPVCAAAMYDDKIVMDFATAITYAVTATPTGNGAPGATITLSAGYK